MVFLNPVAYPESLSPNVTKLDPDMLGVNDVKVIFEGTQADGSSHNIISHPPAPYRFRENSRSSFELRLDYNIMYNVSIVPSFCNEKGKLWFSV